MSKENIVKFEKWYDPYEAIIQKDRADALMLDDALNDIAAEEDVASYEENDMEEIPNALPIRSIMTPMGIFPLSDRILASKQFNIWICHSRIKLTENLAYTLANADGVEYFNVQSPYRFLFSAGKCFEHSEVRNNITKIITDVYESEGK